MNNEKTINIKCIENDFQYNAFKKLMPRDFDFSTLNNISLTLLMSNTANKFSCLQKIKNFFYFRKMLFELYANDVQTLDFIDVKKESEMEIFHYSFHSFHSGLNKSSADVYLFLENFLCSDKEIVEYFISRLENSNLTHHLDFVLFLQRFCNEDQKLALNKMVYLNYFNLREHEKPTDFLVDKLYELNLLFNERYSNIIEA